MHTLKEAAHRRCARPSPRGLVCVHPIEAQATTTVDAQQGDALNPTDIGRPDYFHKVVDCQWACPAHTPVPEYIRLIAAGQLQRCLHGQLEVQRLPRHPRAHLRPAVRTRLPPRARRREEPVAICRLKRVAADYKDDIRDRLPQPATQKNGKRIACIGAGPASLTVARDLLPLGYEVVIYEADPFGRRHDAHADPEVSPARDSDRRRGRLHPRAASPSCGSASASTA